MYGGKLLITTYTREREIIRVGWIKKKQKLGTQDNNDINEKSDDSYTLLLSHPNTLNTKWKNNNNPKNKQMFRKRVSSTCVKSLARLLTGMCTE